MVPGLRLMNRATPEAAGEVLGLQIIDAKLVGDRREHAAHQAHVVIPGQPADHAVAVLHLDPEPCERRLSSSARCVTATPCGKRVEPLEYWR